jgi:hypothetical protein
MQEGQAIRIALNSTEGADGLSDPYVVVHGPDGAELASDDDGGDNLNSWLEFQAQNAGIHYLEARGFSEDAVGRYALAVTPGEIGASPDGAEYLVPNSGGRVSRIGVNDDVDWFTVELIEGRPYRFYVDGVEPEALADPVLTLYNSEGVEIASDDDGGAGASPYLTYVPVAGGPYFAAVSSYGAASSGRYVIRLSDTDVPGTPYTDETLDQGSDERLSRIDMPGDLDNYRVELSGSGRAAAGGSVPHAAQCGKRARDIRRRQRGRPRRSPAVHA